MGYRHGILEKGRGYCISRTSKEMVCSILVHDESYATGGDSMNKWLKISLYFLGGDRAIGMCGESKYVGSGRIMCPQRCL